MSANNNQNIDYSECVDKVSQLKVSGDHKVHAQQQVEENIELKKGEVKLNEQLWQVEQSIKGLWQEFKQLYSETSLEDYFKGTRQWDAFTENSKRLREQLQDKLALYRKLSLEEHQRWHETKRMGNDAWEQSKMFVEGKFGKLDSFFQSLDSSLSSSFAEWKAATQEAWPELKQSSLATLDKMFSGFDSAWEEITVMTPEKLAEYRAWTMGYILDTYNEYSAKLYDTITHDWDLLKDASADQWQAAKSSFASKMSNAQERLTQLKEEASRQYQEKWDATKGMTEEQWNKMKEEANARYIAAQEKLDQINHAWSDMWTKLSSASKDEWDTIKSATYSRLQQLSSSFSDMWSSFAAASASTWYSWTAPFRTETTTVTTVTSESSSVPDSKEAANNEYVIKERKTVQASQ